MRTGLFNSCIFFLKGCGILKCSLTSCKVILIVTYWHLSPFACPGVGGSSADGEVCLDSQSHYYDRSLPPVLVVYEKWSIFLKKITDNIVAFDILDQMLSLENTRKRCFWKQKHFTQLEKQHFKLGNVQILKIKLWHCW